MKKYSLFLALLSISILGFSKPYIKIHRSGSDNGLTYRTVTETHDGNKHTLFCTGAGATMCGWTESPTIATPLLQDGFYDAIDQQNVELIIQDLMNLGQSSGHIIYGNGVDIFWTGTSLSNAIIDVYPEGV